MTAIQPRNATAPPRGQTDARSAALAVLNRLDQGTVTLDAVLDDVDATITKLTRVDRGLFHQLVYGTLRWRLRLDAVIAAYADRPLDRVAPTVRNILRMAVFQLLLMDRIPPSAAVNTAVDLARRHRAARATGFVNAVLRSVLREPGRFRLPDATAAPVDHLALAAAVPRWLVARWIDRMGYADAQRLCDAINTIPPISLRCNDLKNTPTELAAALAPEADAIDMIETVPGGLNLVRPHRPIHQMQAFQEGRFAIQDGAAQLIAPFLGPQPGETVLDACAGLGGKTTHLAQLMNNRGQIIALDLSTPKLRRLNEEARRMGITIIDTLAADLNRPPPSSLPPFDRVLLDAPCSGLGVLRRNPDAKWSAHKRSIGRFAIRQARFLEHLAPLVKPGGWLVYAVCSMEPEENEQVIAHFLKKQPNFAITEAPSITAPAVVPFLDRDGFLRTAPHAHHLDGFFAARLKRTC